MRPSSAIEITLSFHSATPRLLTPQQATSPAQARSTPGSNFHLIVALLAAGHVDRVDRAPTVGDVHHAVVDQGRGFEIALGVAAARLQSAEPDREGEPQLANGIGIDFLERGEAVALIVLVMQQPVLRLPSAFSARSNDMSAARATDTAAIAAKAIEDTETRSFFMQSSRVAQRGSPISVHCSPCAYRRPSLLPLQYRTSARPVGNRH